MSKKDSTRMLIEVQEETEVSDTHGGSRKEDKNIGCHKCDHCGGRCCEDAEEDDDA